MSDLASLKHLKQVNNKIKFCVFGYVREMELELKLANIPMIASYLCLAYYYHNEYFEFVNEYIHTSNDKMTISRPAATYNRTSTTNAIGNQVVKSNEDMIATWTFKINEVTPWVYGKQIDIGFRSTEIKTDNIFPLFGVYMNGVFANKGNGTLIENITTWTDRLVAPRDKLGIIFNTQKNTIILTKNNGILLTIKDVNLGPNDAYKMFVNLYEDDASVTLVDFNVQLLSS
eukprot:270925_1